MMQTMRARVEEAHREENAFKALEAVATTSSENYKDDDTYQRYRDAHADVKECNREQASLTLVLCLASFLSILLSFVAMLTIVFPFSMLTILSSSHPFPLPLTIT